MKHIILFAFAHILYVAAFAQPSRFLPDKPGQWRYETNLPEKAYRLQNYSMTAPENLAFKKNVAELAEWFRQNVPMLTSPKGYDLRALSNYVWGDWTTQSESEYGIPAELGFLFELFYADGSKWKVEPPRYGLSVNALYGGHDGFYFTPESIVDDGTRYDLSQSEKVSRALADLQKYFRIYPLKEQSAPGVDLYEAYRDGWQQNGRRTIVVFNPERPPYWLPVTVKEMADAHLAYFSLIQKREIDRMVLDQLKQEIAELTAEELAAPAFAGHDSHFVLNVNGKRQGYQIMRFNPDYWDRKLPLSAIQFITFWNGNLTQGEMDEQAQRNYPAYPQLLVNQFEWNKIAELIVKGK
jgi:hypothetical protein